MGASILASLAPSGSRRALVLPLYMGSFYPGKPLYEDIVSPVRLHGSVDVFGFEFPLGVLPESTLMGHSEIFRSSNLVSERMGKREMILNTRAWMEYVAPRYKKIVLVRHGDYMPVWSEAVSGSAAADAISIVPVHHRTGLRGTVLKRRIYKALQ
jgi:hypothetical protein